jgi:hypothetical protein
MGWINGSLRGFMKLKIGHSRMRISKTATAEIHGKPSGVSIVVKSRGEKIVLHERCSTKT